MSLRQRWCALVFLLAPIALAQTPADPEFWRSPDVRITDDRGHLVQAIVKDREHYTARWYTNGQWINYRYAPHTERIVRIEASDTTEELLYDAHGAYIGKNIHFAGLVFALRGDHRDRFKAGDLPGVVLQRDADGRVVRIVTDGGDTIAEIPSVEGHPKAVQLGNGVKLAITEQRNGSYREVLTGSAGQALDDRVITNTQQRRRPDDVVLDIVAKDLGVDASPKGISNHWNSTGSVQVVGDRQGKPLVYIARDGAQMAGFDRSGKALYYDLSADLFVGRTEHPENLPDLEAIVPARFTYTRDGRMGAYVWTPAIGAIQSFWTDRDPAGRAVVKMRFSAPGERSATPQSLQESGSERSIAAFPTAFQK